MCLRTFRAGSNRGGQARVVRLAAPLIFMKIFVTAKPGAKRERVERLDDAHFLVAVKEPPIEGRANKAVIAALAANLGVSPSRLLLVSGHGSRRKVIEVLG